MKRKTFINRLTLGGGGMALLPSLGLLNSCTYIPEIRTGLTETDIPLLDELAETLLPASDEAGGSKAAKVGEYILLMFNDCMEAKHRTVFLEGINEIDMRSAKKFGHSFTEANASQKLHFMETLQEEAIRYHKALEAAKELQNKATPIGEEFHDRDTEDDEEPIPHYFDILKGLTISGYFTSEIGMTKARDYLPVPGNFQPCIPYKNVQKPWAL